MKTFTIVVGLEILVWTNSFFYAGVFENQKLRSILIVLVIEPSRSLCLRCAWMEPILQPTNWASLRTCVNTWALVFQFLDFVKYFKQLFLPFIFGYSCLNHRNSSFFINKVWGARTTSRFTLYAIPILLEVCLNQLQSIQSWHFLRSSWPWTFICSRGPRVMGGVLMWHLTIASRFCSGCCRATTISWILGLGSVCVRVILLFRVLTLFLALVAIFVLLRKKSFKC